MSDNTANVIAMCQAVMGGDLTSLIPLVDYLRETRDSRLPALMYEIRRIVRNTESFEDSKKLMQSSKMFRSDPPTDEMVARMIEDDYRNIWSRFASRFSIEFALELAGGLTGELMKTMMDRLDSGRRARESQEKDHWPSDYEMEGEPMTTMAPQGEQSE